MAASAVLMRQENPILHENVKSKSDMLLLAKSINALVSEQQKSNDNIKTIVNDNQNNRKSILSQLKETLDVGVAKSATLFNDMRSRSKTDFLNNDNRMLQSILPPELEVSIKNDEVVNTKDSFLNQKFIGFSNILRSFKNAFVAGNEDMKKGVWRFNEWELIRYKISINKNCINFFC